MRWLILLATTLAYAGDWPRFRGLNGSGVANAVSLPVEFGREKNVKWRATVPPGGSSPVIAAQRLFLTAHEKDLLVTLCFDAVSGKLLWRREVERTRTARRTAPNDPATPSPVTGGDSVYVLFPDFGLLSYAADGRERWRVALPPFDPPHGMATSPILAAGNIIVAADQISGSFVAAFRDHGPASSVGTQRRSCIRSNCSSPARSSSRLIPWRREISYGPRSAWASCRSQARWWAKDWCL